MATLIEQYMLLDREIKALTEQKDAVRKQIGDLSLGKTIIDDDYYLNVSVVRSFDAKAAKEFLSEAEYNRILVTKVDSALARQTLSPENYDFLMKEGNQKWEIKKRND